MNQNEATVDRSAAAFRRTRKAPGHRSAEWHSEGGPKGNFFETFFASFFFGGGGFYFAFVC